MNKLRRQDPSEYGLEGQRAFELFMHDRTSQLIRLLAPGRRVSDELHLLVFITLIEKLETGEANIRDGELYFYSPAKDDYLVWSRLKEVEVAYTKLYEGMLKTRPLTPEMASLN